MQGGPHLRMQGQAHSLDAGPTVPAVDAGEAPVVPDKDEPIGCGCAGSGPLEFFTLFDTHRTPPAPALSPSIRPTTRRMAWRVVF